MTNSAENWNKRYQNTTHSLSKARSFLMEFSHLLPRTGWALDVAMGLGHNADILSRNGLKVIGVDFSYVALQKAVKDYPQILAILAELPNIHFKPASFDVLLNFWFLDRSLFPMIKMLLKPGGLLFFETMQVNRQYPLSEVNPAYLLAENELKSEFFGWEHLVYEEVVQITSRGGYQPAVRLLARKPA